MEKKVFTFPDHRSVPAEEAFHVLRANITFRGPLEGIRTLTVTSCNPLEGKTDTAVNLAISVAGTGQRVLLADADLRKPMTLKALGMEYASGLSNLSSGILSSEDIIYKTSTDNLFFTPSGLKSPNPSELIGSHKFGGFLLYAREHFDLIIIDTPPLCSVIDAAVIAAQTDGTLLVVQFGKTKYAAIRQVKQQLDKVNARLLGAVFNKVRKHAYKRYYHDYNYYAGARQTVNAPKARQELSAGQ